MKYVFIINTKASRAEKLKPRLEQLIKHTFQESTVLWVQNPEQLKNRVLDTVKDRPECLVIGGGDGTISTALKTLTDHNYKGCVGVLPLGTANDFVRELGFTLPIEGAIKSLKTSKTQNLAFPTINGELFTLKVAVGLTVAISSSTQRKQKKKYGIFAYIVEGLKAFSKNNSFSYIIECNGNSRFSGTTQQINITNVNINRSKILTLPAGDINKNTLHLTLFESDKSRLKILLAIFLHIISLGRSKRYILTLEGNDFFITTTPEKSTSIDGEVSGVTPFRAKTSGKNINMLIARGATEQ